MHAFEKAGLGVAPFRCVGVSENVWKSGCGNVTKAGGTCDYCGTGIRYEYAIKSSDDKCFVVGCDCVRKTGDDVADFKRIRQDFVRGQREKKKEEQRKARVDEYNKQREENRKQFAKANTKIVSYLQAYKGNNSFILNMIDAFNAYGTLTDGQMEAMHKVIKQEQEKEKIRQSSLHIGKVGERIKNMYVKVEFTKLIRTGGGFSSGFREAPLWLIKMVTEDGNVLSWFTSTANDLPEGYSLASFTVKEHREYDGINETAVQRVTFK